MSVKNKLVYGIGINDVDYVVQPTSNGRKQSICPYYQTWQNMLKRCYSKSEIRDFPTYNGCSVDSRWHRLSGFKAWMEKQDWKGKHLDKDLLVPGNKVYSPDTCLFVTPAVNALLLDSGASRGKWPRGVSWDKEKNRFAARVRTNGEYRMLGRFTTPEEAAVAYKLAKSAFIAEVAQQQTDPRLRAALLKHIPILIGEAA